MGAFLVLGYLLFGSSLALGQGSADWTLQNVVMYNGAGYPTSSNVSTVVSVHNASAFPVVFTWAKSGAKATSNTGAWDCTLSIPFPAPSGTSWNCVSLATASYSYTYTIAAGATVNVIYPVNINNSPTGMTSLGMAALYPFSATVSNIFNYYEGNTAKSVTLAHTGALLQYVNSGTPKVLWTGSGATGSITISSTTYPYWGTIHVGVPPANGHIRAFGGSAGSNGASEVKIWLGGKVVASRKIIGAGDGDAVPDLVYNSPDPAADAGKVYKISFNGFYWPSGWEGLVTLDAFGSYAYEHNLGPHQAEVGVPDLVTSQAVPEDDGGADGHEMTNGTDPVFDGQLPDASHDRPEQPGTATAANGGTDPKTDTTANTTVKQEYSAVRAAIEDALGRPPSSTDFNFGSWLGGDVSTADERSKASGFADSMKGAVDVVGDIGGALTDAANSGALAPTLGPSTGIVLHNGSGAVIGIIPPPTWANLFRQAMLYLLWLFFALAAVAIAKSAFAGR